MGFKIMRPATQFRLLPAEEGPSASTPAIFKRPGTFVLFGSPTKPLARNFDKSARWERAHEYVTATPKEQRARSFLRALSVFRLYSDDLEKLTEVRLDADSHRSSRTTTSNLTEERR
jgi:hypothetical protein